ncbi:MAG: SMP-30/gluconolactonase/LRE family protein [Deltaproteobacteria bacterium]|nr:SMP-30/gluconolactonase/LRE family protein [Deltaproteobacteria bacterium]
MPLPFRPAALALSLSLTAACGSTAPDAATADGAGGADANASWQFALAPGATVPEQAGVAGKVAVVLKDGAGKAQAGIAVTVTVPAGSGAVDKGTTTTDAKGAVELQWTLGPTPVGQSLHLQAPKAAPFEVKTVPTLATPYTPSAFGKIHEWLEARKIDGSTEDMAIAPDGSRAVMGVPGHFLQVDPAGAVTELTVTGDPIAYPLGMQFAKDGTLWFCDSQGKALRSLSAAGVVKTATTTDGKVELVQPNDLTVDDKGRVWFTDPCLGELLRYDPAIGKTEVLASFDLAEQGGPNGIALSPDGKDVMVTTENVSLLCFKGGAPIGKPLGRAWRADRGEGALKFEPRGAPAGQFGDGCTFDAAGNFYATFDEFQTEPTIALKASTVLVWPKGRKDPTVFLSTHNALFANVVFGRGAFGVDQLYVVLLAVPGFTPPEGRGLVRFEARVPGY